MLKNYLLVALRALRRNTTYTIVNVTGLALGMACCALILMLVYHEWSYDRFHEHADSIHRTYFEYDEPGGEKSLQAMMRPAFTESFRESFSQIEYATTYVTGQQDMRVGDDVSQHTLSEVHNDFFEMFSFPLLSGDAATVLNAPEDIVLSRSLAAGLFGADENDWQRAMGETVSIPRGGNLYDFTVVGVFEDFPDRSSFDFDAAVSFENYGRIQLGGNNWGGRVSTYIKLREGIDAAAFEASFPEFTETEFATDIENLREADFLAEGEDTYRLKLQPLPELHTTPYVWAPYEATIHDPKYSMILMGIGILILLIACINFMTLSVGQSTSRAREVGVRKVLGAHRWQLMKQYFGESTVLSVIALGTGLVITILALPWFSGLSGRPLQITDMSPVLALIGVTGLVLVVGLIAGGYPAVVLSRFQPARVMKGDVRSPGRNRLTQSLVVLQYTISISLIVGTVVMSRQIEYLFDRDLGYDKEQVVAINARQVPRAEADGVIEHFRTSLLPYDQIRAISRTGYSFTRGSDRNGWQDASGVQRSAYNIGVSYDYLDLMGIELAAGRNFSRDFPSDPTDAVLVNEALVEEFGMEDPVGQKLTGWLSFIYDEDPTIIGVVKDFNYRSQHEDVYPLVMNMHPEYYSYFGALLVKIAPDDVPGSLAMLENAWNEIQPGKPYSFSFLEDDVNAQYQSEQRWRTIVTYSSILAIAIACMGLFGLALLTVARRTKEIGIRKVMGASVPNLASLISREFAWLVVIASVIAIPLAYFGMQQWLQNFAYAIELTPGVFIVATIIALTIALGTVSIHSIRAAQSNPADTLRYE